MLALKSALKSAAVPKSARSLVSLTTVKGDAADVHIVTLDDGKMNAASFAMLHELDEALKTCEADKRTGALILTGNDKCFSAGFDLTVMGRGPSADAARMLELGGRMALRLAAWPRPTIIAASGHTIAFGAILLLAADIRIGTSDTPKAKVGLNEVAIGMPVPGAAMELAKCRLSPLALTHTMLGTLYSPADAVTAGFYDQVVPAATLADVALTTAQAVAKLQNPGFFVTKMHARRSALAAAPGLLEADCKGFAGKDRAAYVYGSAKNV